MRVLLIALIAAAYLASTASAAGTGLRPMVLHLGDLPAGFALDYSHAKSKSQVKKEQGHVMPGFVTAWEAQFTRKEGFSTAIAVSAVSRYGSSSQAHASMLDSWKRASKQTKFKRISVGAALGHEARAFTYRTQGVAVFMVVWRYLNLKATVFLGGIESLGASSAQAVRLAHRQQARMVEPRRALAHQHPCHRSHACPSDHATYRWRGLLCVKPDSAKRTSAFRQRVAYGGKTYFCRR